MNEADRKQKKIMQGIFLEFFRHATYHFKGRVDEGNITIKELTDYIDAWIEKHLG